jgi:O-antigen biosynthesis protein WbqP
MVPVAKTSSDGTLLLKRSMDVILALVCLIFLAPLLVAVAVMVRLTSPGPVLYYSDRVGRNNRVFRMAKFRTMRVDTPQVATHLLADPKGYLSPGGGFLRKTSLDELPQLAHILRGDLSFVGPRPALFNQHDLIAMRTELGIHHLTPGLTGWAQVNGRDELSIPVKVRFDYEYLQSQSFAFDLRILGRTIAKILQREGVHH